MTAAGLPGAQCVDHVALTVADLDTAVAFTTEVLGGELVYRLPPLAHDDDWMTGHLDVPPRMAAEIAMVRLGRTTNLELFHYTGAGRNTVPPRWGDPGHQHLGFRVPDAAEAAAAVARITGLSREPVRTAGRTSPLAGMTGARLRTPWGLSLEFRSFTGDVPAGRHRVPGPGDGDGPGRTAAPAVPGLRGVDHIGYAVAGLDDALAVFAGPLGGRLLARGFDGAVETAVLRFGPYDTIELYAHPPAGPAAPPRNCDVGGRHLALHVRDVDTAAAELAAHEGYTVLGGVETIAAGPIAGVRWVYVRTPIGLHIELVRAPDGDLPYENATSARRRPAGTARWTDE
ncbi:VOC family protein [Actinoplanes utahensis]|nr:VOC family protein [Actinoplanes utahensis]GIF33444.1 hypothetical protein Aut01nite_64300 [Actinoplanes utahensis]